MEGQWLIAACERCNAFSLKSVESPSDSLAAVIGALDAKGCDPREAD
jgi:hypothetical protein